MSSPRPISPHRSRVAASDLLETWKEIAAYLNRDLRTVKRWEASRGLPVHRLPGGPKAAIYASKSELEVWRQGAGLDVDTTIGSKAARKLPRVGWIAVGVALATLAVILLSRTPAGKLPPPSRLTPLTHYLGVEWFPAFSPDGKHVAFSWNGEHEDNHDIYVSLVKLGQPVRITADPGMDLAPAWSPDGRYIAFLRWNLGALNFKFFIVPALGGAERQVAEGWITPDAIGIPFPVLSWTRDGAWLIKGSRLGLELVSAETGRTRRLTAAPAGSPGDCCPTVSPDGGTIAFLRASPARTYSPMVLEVTRSGDPRGEPRRLESPPCVNPVWSRDGAELLCISESGEDRSLWRIAVHGKARPRPVPSIGAFGRHLAISPRGDRLVYSNFAWGGDIWELNLSHGKAATRLVASTADDLMPRISPKGDKIAFLSNRSGQLEVWVSDRNGGNASALVPAGAVDAPSWSPNGEEVAYTCRVGARSEDICVIGSAGGVPRLLTKDAARDILPSWSHDGRWIYFASDRNGTFQSWKTRADGSAPAIQVTRKGGFGGIESSDGRFLFYSRQVLSGQICRVPVDGGEEVPLGDGIRSLRLPGNFAVGTEGIYFAASDDPTRRFELSVYSFATKRIKSIAHIEGRFGNGIALSPDGRSLLFPVERHTGDLVMVENFR